MSQTALSGFRNEDWVVGQFNSHRGGSCGAGWLGAMGYRHFSRVCAQTTRRMGFFNKADVLVLVDDNVEWISVKKFIASFNQTLIFQMLGVADRAAHATPPAFQWLAVSKYTAVEPHGAWPAI